MNLTVCSDLFDLQGGEVVSKRNLFDLIQFSKVESSSFWQGRSFLIGNTPQQGINWIGEFPSLKGVIIKVRPGSYESDGWTSIDKTAFNYSFKARMNVVSYEEKANQALINQIRYMYPIFLFSDEGKSWVFEGRFAVSEIKDTHVVVKRSGRFQDEAVVGQIERYYEEGGRKYVAHLMAERSSGVVGAIKTNADWVCEICKINFEKVYNFPYIEAHHKKAISTYDSLHQVATSDLALLCPNCHAAVHLYMKKTDLEYAEIKRVLNEKMRS